MESALHGPKDERGAGFLSIRTISRASRDFMSDPSASSVVGAAAIAFDHAA